MKDPKRYLLLALPAIAVGLVYVSTRKFGYVWDDLLYLGEASPYLGASFGEAFSGHFVLSPNYYRPLAVLTLILDLGRGEGAPSALHVTNGLVHVLNTGLLTVLAFLVAGRRIVPGLLAGLVYGFHPALVEGVAFASGRFDLLVTTFLLCALVADVLLEGRTAARAIVVGAAFLLAALCKESAACLALVLPAWHVSRRASTGALRIRENQIVYAALVVAGAIYLLLRYRALGHLHDPAAPGTLETGSGLSHVLLVCLTGVTALELGTLPFPFLSPIHFAVLPVPEHDAAAWWCLIVLLAVIAGLVLWIERAPRSGWLALAALLSLVPAMNVLPLQLDGGSYFAERYLVFPAALLVLSAVALHGDLERRRPDTAMKLGLSASGLWIAASLVVVATTLPHWTDELTLWTWGVKRAPRSALPRANLAGEHFVRGEHEACVRHGERALELDPMEANAASNLGACLLNLGRLDKAGRAFTLAVTILPDDAGLWTNLAVYQRSSGQLEAAVVSLRDHALAIAPDDPLANLLLGATYMDLRRPGDAVPYLERALPNLSGAHAKDAAMLLERARDGR